MLAQPFKISAVTELRHRCITDRRHQHKAHHLSFEVLMDTVSFGTVCNSLNVDRHRVFAVCMSVELSFRMN